MSESVITETSEEVTHDFVAAGADAVEPVRFHWKLDNDTLKDINRAIGLDTTTHGRGFLGRLMLLWLSLKLASRPRFEVARMRHDDLIFVPSPCYIVAISNDRKRFWLIFNRTEDGINI